MQNNPSLTSLTSGVQYESGGGVVPVDSPLADHPSLYSLDLEDCNLTSLAGLGSMAQLDYLDLDDNRLTSLDGLGAAGNLSQLDVRSNGTLSDIDAIEFAPNLTRLYLSGNNITTLPSQEVMATFTKLTYLNLESNYSLTNEGIAPLAGLTNLEELYMYRASLVDDLSPIQSLVRIERLSLAATGITDLDFCTALVSLDDLNINDTEVSDLSPLLDISSLNLKTLHISSLPLSCSTTSQSSFIDQLQSRGVTVYNIPSGCE
jgi:internalin A